MSSTDDLRVLQALQDRHEEDSETRHRGHAARLDKIDQAVCELQALRYTVRGAAAVIIACMGILAALGPWAIERAVDQALAKRTSWAEGS